MSNIYFEMMRKIIERKGYKDKEDYAEKIMIALLKERISQEEYEQLIEMLERE